MLPGVQKVLHGQNFTSVLGAIQLSHQSALNNYQKRMPSLKALCLVALSCTLGSSTFVYGKQIKKAQPDLVARPFTNLRLGEPEFSPSAPTEEPAYSPGWPQPQIQGPSQAEFQVSASYYPELVPQTRQSLQPSVPSIDWNTEQLIENPPPIDLNPGNQASPTQNSLAAPTEGIYQRSRESFLSNFGALSRQASIRGSAQQPQSFVAADQLRMNSQFNQFWTPASPSNQATPQPSPSPAPRPSQQPQPSFPTEQNTIFGSSNFVLGSANRVEGDQNRLVGNMNAISGRFNTAIGLSNGLFGNRNGALGNYNAVVGDGNVVVGNANGVFGNGNEVQGHANGVSGDGNWVVGNFNTVGP